MAEGEWKLQAELELTDMVVMVVVMVSFYCGLNFFYLSYVIYLVVFG